MRTLVIAVVFMGFLAVAFAAGVAEAGSKVSRTVSKVFAASAGETSGVDPGTLDQAPCYFEIPKGDPTVLYVTFDDGLPEAYEAAGFRKKLFRRTLVHRFSGYEGCEAEEGDAPHPDQGDDGDDEDNAVRDDDCRKGSVELDYSKDLRITALRLRYGGKLLRTCRRR